MGPIGMLRPFVGSGGSTAAGFSLGGPVGAIGLGVLGAAQGFLGGNEQRKLKRRIDSTLSPQGYAEAFNRQYGVMAPLINAQMAGARRGAGAAASGIRGGLARSGITGGIADVAAGGAEAYGGEQASLAFNRGLLTVHQAAEEERQRKLQALLAMYQTPGNVSPISAALAGAGSGLEAASNAAYAERLAGVFGR